MAWLTESRERLARFRAGEAAFLSDVYSQYAPGLARSLSQGVNIMVDGVTYRFNAVASAFDLDDTVQETFIRAFSESARNAFDGIRPFHTWLVSIARNLLIDRFRQTQRAASLFTALESADAAPSVDPESQVANAQLKKVYADFLASLDEEGRTLMRLRVEQDETRRSVTAATGLSAMQVRSRETQLRKRLFDLLRAVGYVLAILLGAR